MTRKNTATVVVLDEEQKEELQAFACSRSLPHALANRARIILLASEGAQNLEISEKVGLNSNDVGKWRRRYAEYGISGLYDGARPGRPRSISDEKIAALITRTLAKKPKNATHWSTRLIARSHSPGPARISAVSRALAKCDHSSSCDDHPLKPCSSPVSDQHGDPLALKAGFLHHC